MIDGFHADIPTLKAAVAELKEQREELADLGMQASKGIKPGELVADDLATKNARKAIEERAVSSDGALNVAARELHRLLHEKITAYESTIAEYERRDADALPNQLPGDARQA